MRNSALVLLCAVLTVWSGSARAQTDLENVLRQFDDVTVKGYMQPAVDLFAVNMLSGLYYSADIPRLGFSATLDFVGMGAFVGDDQKLYDVRLPESYGGKTFRTATFFGPRGTEYVDPQNPSLTYKGQDGILDAGIFPLASPQLRIGSLYGTEALIRFIPIPSIGEAVPYSQFLTLGLRHDVDQYFGVLPIQLAFGIYYGSFRSGDIVKFKGYAMVLQASRAFSVLTVYGGLAMERTTMNVNYTPNIPGSSNLEIDLDLPGKSRGRATLGVALITGPFNMFVDANLGSFTALSGGIGFGF